LVTNTFRYEEHEHDGPRTHIAGGWVWEPKNDDREEEDEGDVDDSVVYLVSGGQVHDRPYGPRRAFDEAVESL
jgi:hypothetical protein